LTAFAVLAVFAGYESDPAAAAETEYLALLVGAVLLAVGALAPAPASELSFGAVLATAAVWAFPQGPGRGAVVVALLAVLLAAAGGRAFATHRMLPPAAPAITVPLALGLQVLLRGELLFGPDLAPRRLFALLVLPVAAALAVSVLARGRPASLALLAGATAAILGPGFDVATTLALVGLAAGELVAAGPLAARLAAGAVLAGAVVWEPGPGAAVALCALALWKPRLAAALAGPAAAAMLFWLDASDWRHILWLPLLVPAVVLPDRRHWARLATGAVLAAAVPWSPDMAALAAPLGLVALSLAPAGPAKSLQTIWAATLLGATALLASYPWLRPEPLVEALSWFGLAPRPLPALGCAVVLLALAAAGSVLRPVWAGRLAGATVIAAAALHLPSPGVSLIPEEMPVVLDAARPSWDVSVGGSLTRRLIVESTLANSASLPSGSAVARIRLVTTEGETLEYPLRTGTETGEWAARRPDLAKAAPAQPRAWISWVAGDFFAQRYRCRVVLEDGERLASLTVERLSHLPADVTVALHGARLVR
jgi:hypothetical protein